MSAWQRSMGVADVDITFLADVDGKWAQEHGLDRDYGAVSLGRRAARFSMIVVDGKVKVFNVVEDAKNDAANVLKLL